MVPAPAAVPRIAGVLSVEGEVGHGLRQHRRRGRGGVEDVREDVRARGAVARVVHGVGAQVVRALAERARERDHGIAAAVRRAAAERRARAGRRVDPDREPGRALRGDGRLVLLARRGRQRGGDRRRVRCDRVLDVGERARAVRCVAGGVGLPRAEECSSRSRSPGWRRTSRRCRRRSWSRRACRCTPCPRRPRRRRSAPPCPRRAGRPTFDGDGGSVPRDRRRGRRRRRRGST